MKDRPARFDVLVLASIAALSLAVPACGNDDPPAATDPDSELKSEHDASPPSASESDAGSGVVIQVECPIGTAVELEGNDTPETANEFEELSFCGALTPGSDVDYSKFKTPEGKKLVLFQAVIDGAVDFDLLVNGKTLRPSDVRKFEAGEYLIKAYTKDGKPGKYSYRIQFEP